MSMTRYATLCQQCRIFVVRVPLLFGACRRVRIKGRGGHVLAVPSHASRGACCHCRYPQSRNDHAHAGHSIDPLRVSNRVSKTPKESWRTALLPILLAHPFLLRSRCLCNFSENSFHLRKDIYILFSCKERERFIDIRWKKESEIRFPF